MSLSTISNYISDDSNSPTSKSRIRSMRDDFLSLLETGKDSDVVFVVDKREIKAHKLILKARSTYFTKLFESKMEENQMNRVEIPDFRYEVIQEMLNFLYAAEAPNLDQMSAELFVAADKYDLGELKKMCEKQLSLFMNPSKAIQALVVGHKLNSEQMTEKAVDYIAVNYERVKREPDWEEIWENVDIMKYLNTKFAQKLSPPLKKSKLIQTDE